MARATRTVWIEKKAVLEFCGAGRDFPFTVHTNLEPYVAARKEDFVEFEATMEYDPHNGQMVKCRFGRPPKPS